ncbi:metal ABC transporter substrate-binding protein [Variovorax paradoxus]|uniref:metal ABC transporter substrate-binding protein n=1 Tax=Variovorax paradoxus TaxID=34073 RepID=UPI00035D8875|nr:metal ABC transporter substrate-binding protein [Variovorax paradoxus]
MNFPSNPARRCFFAASLVALPLPVLAQSTAPRPLRVVASFSILADMAREIGGSAVEVAALVGPDSDAHVFQPSPADARRLANAELVVVNGLAFEGWMDRLVRSSGYRGPVVVASDGVPVRRMGRAPDPHAWQDLANAQRYAANLRDAMARARPAFAAEIGRRCASYIERLQALDREIRARFDAMPREHRRVISSHDAFGYFGAAYGIEFLAPQGMNTDSEASAASVARLIGQIRREDVRAVFVENISDPRLVQRIAREGGVTVGGRLYSDALSAPGTEADTYLKLFAHNATTIASALSAKR